MRDITNGLHLKPAFAPKAAVGDGTAQVSTVADLKGYDGCMLALALGINTDTDAVWSVLIEDSDNDSDYVAVDDVYLNGTELLAGFAFGDDGECRKIGYTGPKRYVRATIDDTTANTGDLFVAGMWVLRPLRTPAANPPA